MCSGPPNYCETAPEHTSGDRKSTRLNSSHGYISYAVFCLKKKRCAQRHTAKGFHRRTGGNRTAVVNRGYPNDVRMWLDSGSLGKVGHVLETVHWLADIYIR